MGKTGTTSGVVTEVAIQTLIACSALRPPGPYPHRQQGGARSRRHPGPEMLAKTITRVRLSIRCFFIMLQRHVWLDRPSG